MALACEAIAIVELDPPPWRAEGKDVSRVSRRVTCGAHARAARVPVAEIWRLRAHFAAQLVGS